MPKFSSPLLNYENKWVALSPDREEVVTAADSIKQLEKKVLKLGKKDVVFTWVPPFDKVLAP